MWPRNSICYVIQFAIASSYNEGAYDDFHFNHPWKPVMGGEAASCVSDRGYYLPTNASAGFVNEEDQGCVAGAWQPAGVRDFVSGNFAWTGFDVSFLGHLMLNLT